MHEEDEAERAALARAAAERARRLRAARDAEWEGKYAKAAEAREKWAKDRGCISFRHAIDQGIALIGRREPASSCAELRE